VRTEIGPLCSYFRFLNRIQLTWTEWVEFVALATTFGRGGHNRSFQNVSLLSLCGLLSTGRQLWCVSFVTTLKWNLFAYLTTSNTTANNCIISYAQKATVLQPSVFLTGIHQFLITSGDRLSQRELPGSTTNSSVIISTMLRVEGPKMPSRSSIVFYFPDRPDFFLGPPSFLYSFGHQEWCGQGAKVTANIRQAPRLRIREAVLPLFIPLDGLVLKPAPGLYLGLFRMPRDWFIWVALCFVCNLVVWTCLVSASLCGN
jgi:hypothetical protein